MGRAWPSSLPERGNKDPTQSLIVATTNSRGGGWSNHEQPRSGTRQQRPAEEWDGARTMRRKRSPVGKPQLFLSVEPSSRAGRALRAKPEGVGSGHGHCSKRHAQAFSAKTWGPLTGTAQSVTFKPFPQRRGVAPRPPPQTPRSSLLRKRVGSPHGHRQNRLIQPNPPKRAQCTERSPISSSSSPRSMRNSGRLSRWSVCCGKGISMWASSRAYLMDVAT